MTYEKLLTAKRIKALIYFITTLLIVIMFPRGESIETEVNIGTVWIKDDLIAPFSFPVYKNNVVYKKEVDLAQSSVIPIFLKQIEVPRLSIDSVIRFNNFFLKVLDDDISGTQAPQSNPTFLSSETFRFFRDLRLKEKQSGKKEPLGISEIFFKVENFLRQVYSIGILSIPETQLNRDSIALRTGNIDQIELKSQYYDVKNAIEPLKNQLLAYNVSDENLKHILEYAKHFVFPNLVYNKAATEQERNLAKNKVSKYTGIVNENERIIAKHERITTDSKLKIDSYKIAKGETIGTEGILLQNIGKFLHIAFLIILLGIYLYLFRPKIYKNNLKLIIFSILFVWIAFITYLVNLINVDDAVRLLIFIPTVSMLMTILFDSRVGFYSTVIISLVAGALRGNDYSFVVMNIVAGAFAAYTVRDIKNRSHIFRSFIFILIGYVVTILAFALERYESYDKILIESAFAATNALLSPVLTYGLLIFFEHFFKITTDLTLLELSNFDRPLLRDLARKAPGTFNHSITMGTLAEAAAEAIGASSLLARVGAYYHDIGKSLTPQYFVENQLNNINPHEDLLPKESVKVLKGHIEKGIELARQNDIPPEITNFIPMHHGTNVISYFYDKAKKIYGEENIEINDFRYSGPKPDSRETAIVMLADACESAVRSIDNPDFSKIENLIHHLIDSRIVDGQLDESSLTLKDIKTIKESFAGILVGQSHKRIRYPKQDELEKKD
ncbi:MAG: HD family phosphohydrolase [Ignavibacteriaceae bacterium]